VSDKAMLQCDTVKLRFIALQTLRKLVSVCKR